MASFLPGGNVKPSVFPPRLCKGLVSAHLSGRVSRALYRDWPPTPLPASTACILPAFLSFNHICTLSKMAFLLIFIQL